MYKDWFFCTLQNQCNSAKIKFKKLNIWIFTELSKIAHGHTSTLAKQNVVPKFMLQKTDSTKFLFVIIAATMYELSVLKLITDGLINKNLEQ